jgi:hypothetical protein
VDFQRTSHRWSTRACGVGSTVFKVTFHSHFCDEISRDRSRERGSDTSSEEMSHEGSRTPKKE